MFAEFYRYLILNYRLTLPGIGQFTLERKPSQADKNITWTILALSMRASEYIIEEKKKNNL